MDIQKRWDQLLCVGWMEDKSIGWCVIKLFGKELTPTEALKELSKIERSIASDGHLYFKMPVRAFFACRCENLSNKFFDGELPLMYSDKLGEYNWHDPKPRRGAANNRYRKRIGAKNGINRNQIVSGPTINNGKHEWNKTS